MQNNVIYIKKFYGATIIIGKNSIQAVYPQKKIYGSKFVYEIKVSSKAGLKGFIAEKREEIRSMLDAALDKVVSELGSRLRGPIKWVRREDWLKTKVSANYPQDAILHGDGVKKVYDDGVEFLDDDDFVDRLKVGEGDDRIIRLLEIQKPLNTLMLYVKCIDDILNYEYLVLLLSDQQKLDFSEWVFDRFGVSPES